MPVTGRPNLGADLRRIHAVITRALNVTSERSTAYARAGYPDAPTREGFLIYVRTLASTLHGHHLTEDELAFPSFRQRIPGAPFDKWTADHQQIVRILAEIDPALHAAASSEEAGQPLRDLHATVDQLIELWRPHIGEEEAYISVEATDALFSPEETTQLGEAFARHSQQHSGPDYLVVPFLLYNLAAEGRAAMARAMPPVVTEQLVPVMWAEKWQPMRPFLLD